MLWKWFTFTIGSAVRAAVKCTKSASAQTKSGWALMARYMAARVEEVCGWRGSGCALRSCTPN
jgi:hypothetical protein